MNLQKIKKVAALLAVVSVFSTSGFTIQVKADTTTETTSENTYNYAKALQLSLYFYDANKCGKVSGNDDLAYRGDCHLKDASVPLIPAKSGGTGTNLSASFIEANKNVLDADGNGSVDLSGGYHDAGDHVKFGLPQSYSASTLGWGYYEFKDSYAKIGEQDHMEDILRWFNDYFIRCTFRDADGNVVAFAYQVGDGNIDHCYWGSPELQDDNRPAWFASAETPASDQCAGAAASLAVNYLNFKDSDADYANKCLDTAKALYKFAQNNRGLGYSGGYYNSSGDEDELSWAAVWLNIATGNSSYINDITATDNSGNYTGYMKKILNSKQDSWQNIWVHSWDVVWGGVFAKLAPITNDSKHWYFFRWNAEYWSGVAHENANDNNYLKPTPGNFRVISTWGSARYNAAAQLSALVYNKYKTNTGFNEWAKSQMNYILGDNPLNKCYEVGYAENSAKYPHHRASHGSVTNNMEVPIESKHTLWGALVGGPDTSDYHNDVRTDFVYNEVACDYNAGFVGALAGLYEIYGQGQKPDADFPLKEEDATPFYVTAKLEQENNQRTQITVKINNDTATPPRKVSNLKARYFFNISELLSAGQTIKNVSAQIMYDEAKIKDSVPAVINGPVAYDEEHGIYYIEIDWTGNNFHGSREFQFALVAAQDSKYKTNWNPTNDWSRAGITSTAAKTDLISVYLGDEKVLGTEPAKGDFQPPIAPSNLKCDEKTSNSVSLSWTASTDNVAVTKYDIYNGSTLVGTSTTSNYIVTGLSANTTYSFNVKAEDAVGNISPDSSALSVTTNSDSKVLLGDVNGNGEIDMVDYIALQKYVLLGESNTINKQNADINGDTRINTADLFALRKIIIS